MEITTLDMGQINIFYDILHLLYICVCEIHSGVNQCSCSKYNMKTNIDSSRLEENMSTMFVRECKRFSNLELS